MSYLKKTLALILALAFVFVVASCGKSSSSKTNTTQTNEQGKIVNGTTGEVVASGTDTSNGTVSADKGTGNSSKTTKYVSPVTIINTPGMSKINDQIHRTTDKNGNASDAFVKSLKGYNLKIYNPWKGAEPGTEIYDQAAFVEKQVEDEYGVTINETGNWEGYNDTVFAEITSGRPSADIYKVQDFNYATYVNKKFMANMTKAMTTAGVDMKEPWYNQEARKFFNINNGQYAWAGSDSTPYVIFYNKDMIAKKGLTDPATLAAKKQWTWDTLKTYSQKLKTTTIEGMSCGTTPDDFLASMVVSSGGSLVNIVDGKPKTNIKSAVVKNCLQTLATWTKNNSVVNLTMSNMWSEAPKKFAKGEIGMLLDMGNSTKALTSQKSTFKLGVVPFPTPKSGQSYVCQRKIQYMDFIPAAKSVNAAKILFIRNEMYRVSYRFWDVGFQIRNKSFFSVGSNELKMFGDLCYDRNGYKSATNFASLTEKAGAQASTSWTVFEVVSGTKTPQAAIDAYSTMIEKEYSTVWAGLKITGK